MDKVLIIDGLNNIFRAASVSYFGSKSKKDNIEENTSVEEKPSYTTVYSFFRNLRASVEALSSNKIFFCLEGKDNFRYALYPEYKANRIIKQGSDKQKFHSDVHRQKSIIIDLLSCLPITIVDTVGYEGDDIVATLAHHLKDEDTTILSGDTDFIQLLQNGYDKLKIFDPMKKEFAKAPEYHYKTWKILRGDKNTDNIPGIVGPKMAEVLAKDPEKLKDFLSSEENRAGFSLNKELIELKIIDYNKLIFTEYDINFEKLKNAFISMEMKTMIEEKYWNRFIDTFSFN